MEGLWYVAKINKSTEGLTFNYSTAHEKVMPVLTDVMRWEKAQEILLFLSVVRSSGGSLNNPMTVICQGYFIFCIPSLSWTGWVQKQRKRGNTNGYCFHQVLHYHDALVPSHLQWALGYGRDWCSAETTASEDLINCTMTEWWQKNRLPRHNSRKRDWFRWLGWGVDDKSTSMVHPSIPFPPRG